MKLEKVADAEKAVRVYERALRDVEWAQEATHFEVSCGKAKDSITKATDIVFTDMTSYSGTLARELHAAVLKFKSGHLEMAKAHLKQLGVEIT